jgi:hypothetical protein
MGVLRELVTHTGCFIRVGYSVNWTKLAAAAVNHVVGDKTCRKLREAAIVMSSHCACVAYLTSVFRM